MVSIRWCCKQKQGIRLIEPNINLVEGYLKMTEASIGTMNREKRYNKMFSISACYYSMYYSLYAILMKIGIKCEIHACTLEFMKFGLSEFYAKEDFKIIKKAFDLRNIAQYYVDKVIDDEDFDYIFSKVLPFIEKSKEILGKLNEREVNEVRGMVEDLIK